MADVSVDPECNDPKELFGQGVRALILQDYESAVAALSKTSELLVVEHKDDLHDSLAEVYLYYGKALLGLSREQNEALGDAVPKNSAEDSEDDEEPDEGIDSEESEKNKTEENSAASSVNGERSRTDSKTDEKNTEEESKEEIEEEGKMETSDQKQARSSKLVENGEAGPSSSKAADDEATDEQNAEDDASDLQLAWEVLELAKRIFQRLDEKKSLADTLIVLGEVSLESENFESAINDIKQGFEIQKELFAKDSRTVAETLYKLGMAYATNSQIDEAIDSFNNSLEYLRNRIKTLEEIKSMSQEHKDEVEEIKSLIPDIEDKIADMKVYKEEAIKKIAEAFKEPAKPTQDGAGSSKQVSNISHLVKRKRKLDETEEKPNDDVPAKKPAV